MKTSTAQWLGKCSFKTGVFPDDWKEAIVAPILKKGDPTDKKL